MRGLNVSFSLDKKKVAISNFVGLRIIELPDLEIYRNKTITDAMALLHQSETSNTGRTY